MKVKLLSCIQLFATPWTAAYQAPPSMGFSRQEYWSGVPLPSPQVGKWCDVFGGLPACFSGPLPHSRPVGRCLQFFPFISSRGHGWGWIGDITLTTYISHLETDEVDTKTVYEMKCKLRDLAERTTNIYLMQGSPPSGI